MGQEAADPTKVHLAQLRQTRGQQGQVSCQSHLRAPYLPCAPITLPENQGQGP